MGAGFFLAFLRTCEYTRYGDPGYKQECSAACLSVKVPFLRSDLLRPPTCVSQQYEPQLPHRNEDPYTDIA